MRRLENANKSLTEKYVHTEEEYKKLDLAFNEDKVNYKKKFNEANSELSVAKDKTIKLDSTVKTLQTSVKNLESELKQAEKEKSGLRLKLDELKRSQDKLIRQEEERERLAETLSVQNMNNNQKINDYKSRLDSERKNFEVMEVKYEEQLQHLAKSRDLLQSEIDEARWALEKEVQKYEATNAKNKDLNEQILDLNQEIIQLEEKQLLAQEEAEQKSGKIAHLEQELEHTQKRVKEGRDAIKEKEQMLYSHEKKGSQYE